LAEDKIEADRRPSDYATDEASGSTTKVATMETVVDCLQRAFFVHTQKENRVIMRVWYMERGGVSYVSRQQTTAADRGIAAAFTCGSRRSRGTGGARWSARQGRSCRRCSPGRRRSGRGWWRKRWPRGCLTRLRSGSPPGRC